MTMILFTILATSGFQGRMFKYLTMIKIKFQNICGQMVKNV